MITHSDFHVEDILRLLGIDPEQMRNERFTCAVLAALYKNHWTSSEPSRWKYIGLNVPIRALAAAADAIPYFDDVDDDELWKEMGS